MEIRENLLGWTKLSICLEKHIYVLYPHEEHLYSDYKCEACAVWTIVDLYPRELYKSLNVRRRPSSVSHTTQYAKHGPDEEEANISDPYMTYIGMYHQLHQ